MSKNRFYVTTPIYYGTAKPHLGSLYSTLIADVINRWERLKGKETFFLTGTDEHGQKIAQAAQQAGVSPQQFVDSFIEAYTNTWGLYSIDYSHFIRTTDPYHIKGVQELIQKLMDQGDIYKALYKGWYCTPCETYISNAEDTCATQGPRCPSCTRETIAIAEESYFFRLSAYQDQLLQFYKQHPDFIVPKERYNEVLRFVQDGLKDLSISRTTLNWGVPFPGNSEHVVYVWVDALCNYITAIGYGDIKRKNELAKWWPADVQVLGKDIIRFHAVYWPAMLMAVQLFAPRRLLVHGWIQVDKQKMSKSRGNVVDPIELANTYGVDQVRYYLMRQIPINADGDFSTRDLEERITADLANDLGNLLNRMIILAQKHDLTNIALPEKWHQAADELYNNYKEVVRDFAVHMNNYEIHLAIARIWQFIHQVNAYFHAQEPWKIAKKEPLFAEIIAATCHSLQMIAVCLWPVMPSKMEQLLQSIGRQIMPLGQLDESQFLHSFTEKDISEGWRNTFMLQKSEPLFAKIEEDNTKQPTQKDQAEAFLSIDDFAKVELRVGTIMAAEYVPASEKLIQMQVDLGPLGMRQILAGIRASYDASEVVGKQGIFVCNLKPRKMLGVESQGMMLVAHDRSGKAQILAPLQAVANGARLQ